MSEKNEFLSTLPARGATIDLASARNITIFLSTLPARGATEGFIRAFSAHSISIHTPREGSDKEDAGSHAQAGIFLSTLPARGATQHIDQDDRRHVISIHTPREGSDSAGGYRVHRPSGFLSTLPARGATAKPNKNTAGFCAKGPNADLGCTKWEGQFCAISMIFLRAGAVRRGFAGANLPVGPCALGLRTGGGRRPDYTSSTSSWDHCGARPMCSTRVL